MRWSAVDLYAGTLRIDATVIRVPGRRLAIHEFPKTTAGRRILALPAFVVELLRRRAQGRPSAASTVVFTTPHGGLRDPNNTSGALRKTPTGRASTGSPRTSSARPWPPGSTRQDCLPVRSPPTWGTTARASPRTSTSAADSPARRRQQRSSVFGSTRRSAADGKQGTPDGPDSRGVCWSFVGRAARWGGTLKPLICGVAPPIGLGSITCDLILGPLVDAGSDGKCQVRPQGRPWYRGPVLAGDGPIECLKSAHSLPCGYLGSSSVATNSRRSAHSKPGLVTAAERRRHAPCRADRTVAKRMSPKAASETPQVSAPRAPVSMVDPADECQVCAPRICERAACVCHSVPRASGRSVAECPACYTEDETSSPPSWVPGSDALSAQSGAPGRPCRTGPR